MNDELYNIKLAIAAGIVIAAVLVLIEKAICAWF